MRIQRTIGLTALPALLLLLGAEGLAAQEGAISGADTSWMLISTALVLLMTPGLAFFYGGLVNSRNALNTMMMSFVALGVSGGALGPAGVLTCLRG